MRTVEELRAAALDLIGSGIRAADPAACVVRHLEVDGRDLVVGAGRALRFRPKQLVVVAFGKAALGMAAAAVDIVGDRLSGGLVVVPRGSPVAPAAVTLLEAGHPLPDSGSVGAAHELVQLLGRQGPNGLIVALISGGGSSLVAAPAAGLSLDDKRATIQTLLSAGVAVDELNTVRKHLSSIKGGGLLRHLEGTSVVSLVLSDVVGDRLDVIASGPLVADPSTFADAWRVITAHGLEETLPVAVIAHLERGLAGDIPETVKADEACRRRTTNVIVGSNRLSLGAAERRARSVGWNTWVMPEPMVGAAATAGGSLGEMAVSIKAGRGPVRPPACILGGGETTVRVAGSARGGRNQELVLAAAERVSGLEGVVVASVGTDGIDGPTDAAGGLVDGSTTGRGAARGLSAAEALARHDSYAFLDAVDGLIRTGATGTNVMDLQLLLVSD